MSQLRSDDKTREDLVRAADVLRRYAGVVRACHSSELERFAYLPDIEDAAQAVEAAARPSSAVAERTPADYAIEHGEYLAKAAEGFLAACDRVAAVEEDDQADITKLHAAEESRGDHYKGVRDAVYEFRKRADRAKAAPRSATTALPVAFVPLHPKNGPLWANTIPSRESDHPQYELMPLYASPSASTALPDVPLCDGHAAAWFTERNHLPGDQRCVACAFLGVEDSGASVGVNATDKP